MKTIIIKYLYLDKQVFHEYHSRSKLEDADEYHYSNFHRDDGPAFIEYIKLRGVRDILREGYIVNGKIHRTDGPAVIRYSPGVISYFKEGKPIIHKIIEGERYYLFGKELTKDQFYDEEFRESFIMEHS